VPFQDTAGQNEFAFHRMGEQDRIFSWMEFNIYSSINSQQGNKDSINLVQENALMPFYRTMQQARKYYVINDKYENLQLCKRQKRKNRP
jgi:uncharacterized membrane protein (UPF0182 family)